VYAELLTLHALVHTTTVYGEISGLAAADDARCLMCIASILVLCYCIITVKHTNVSLHFELHRQVLASILDVALSKSPL
jgi:hypothetical protein